MNYLKRITRFWYKWLWCSLIHKKYRCYPCDNIYWHCEKCHDCDEEVDIIINRQKPKWF